jgi:hypothetical protein
LLRLINLFIFKKDYIVIEPYIDSLYDTIEEFKFSKKYGVSIQKFEQDLLKIFKNKDVQDITTSKYNMFSVYLTIVMLHCLCGSNFNSLSKEINRCDGTTPIVSDKRLKQSQTTLQTVISNIVTRVEFFIELLVLYGIKDIHLDQKFMYKALFTILKQLEFKTVNGLYFVKIIKVIRSGGGVVNYTNVINNNLPIKVSAEYYTCIYYTPPTILGENPNYLAVPRFVLFGIKLIKQTRNKKKTIITSEFCSPFLLSMQTPYFLDYTMLDKTKELAIEQMGLLKRSRVEVVNSFVNLGVEGVEIEGFDPQDIYSELDNLITQINNKVSEESRVETKRLLEIIKTSSGFKDKVIEEVGLRVANYNKKHGTGLTVPDLEGLETFIKENQGVFIRNGKSSGLVFINKGVVVSDTAWAILKKNTASGYTELRKKTNELKKLMVRMDTIDSNIANINYFFEYYQYIKTNKVQKVYWLNFSDGRGRLYIKSPVSIQANWLYRYIYHFGEIKYNEYLKYKPIVKDYMSKKLTDRLKNLGIEDIHTLNIFLSIGAIFKNQIKTTDGYRLFIDTVELGIEVYSRHLDSPLKDVVGGLDDRLMLIYYTHIIENIKNRKICKWYIIKDTTASINQHAGKLFGFRKESLEYVNLTNTTKYYDTYELFISELLKYIKLKKPDSHTKLAALLNRKVLKQLIMTIGYSIGPKQAYVDWVGTIDDLAISHSDKEFLKKNFHLVFNFLKSGCVDTTILYKNPRVVFIKALKELEYFNLSDIKIPLCYYYSNTTDLKFYNAGKVYTVSYTTTDYGKVDVVKTDTALIVNCIHALDAIYLRRIIVLANDCGICIGPLHDGYFIPFYHVDMLLFIANRAFVVDEIVEILGNVNADIPPIHSTSILL